MAVSRCWTGNRCLKLPQLRVLASPLLLDFGVPRQRVDPEATKAAAVVLPELEWMT